MSMPRATISVATNILILPALKSCITASRWTCSRSECISPTFSFIDFKAFVTSLTLILEDAKIITRSGTSSIKRLRIIPNF